MPRPDLLDQIIPFASRIYIPRPVALEISLFDSPSDPACAWLKTAAARGLIVDSVEASDFITAWGLGAGESSVIAMAQNLPGSIAVLDDLAARRCAGALRINIVGTLGLLLLAKNARVIPTIRGPLDAIVSAGLYISRRHVTDILKQAGE